MQSNFNYTAFIWWRLDSVLWNRTIKLTDDVGLDYFKITVFLMLLFYFQFFLLLISLFSVSIALGKEWLQMYCLLHCLKH